MKNENSIVVSMKQKIKRFDWKLLIPYLLLMGMGIIMVYSSSSYLAMTNYNNSERFLLRQLIFAVLSVVGVGFFSLINKKLLKSKSVISVSLVIIFFLLLYLVVLGVATNGATSWISIGPFNLQPVEFLKIATILYFGVFFSNCQYKLASIEDIYESREQVSGEKGQTLRKMLSILKKPILFLGIFMLLVALQPDMGGVIIITAVSFVMFLISGIPFKYGLVAVGGAGAVYGLFIGLIMLFGDLPFLPAYMVERFTAFLDPFQDMKDSSFQLVNSFYALARGGLFGVGLGESVQKTGYLPEAHTDFVIPIMAEELGLIWVIGILAVFFYLVFRIYRISMKITDSFGQLVCVGIATLFLVQGSINVGGAIGLMPLTGVTFPFISYGGSSMLVSSIALGIVNNIYVNNKNNAAEKEGSNE